MRAQPRGLHAVLGEPIRDGLRPRFRERLVVGIAANIVGVSLDLDLKSFVFREKVRYLLQNRIRSRLQRGFVEIEQSTLINLA